MLTATSSDPSVLDVLSFRFCSRLLLFNRFGWYYTLRLRNRFLHFRPRWYHALGFWNRFLSFSRFRRHQAFRFDSGFLPLRLGWYNSLGSVMTALSLVGAYDSLIGRQGGPLGGGGGKLPPLLFGLDPALVQRKTHGAAKGPR